MARDIIEKICKKLTSHRWRKIDGFSVGIEPTEYYYKCRICRSTFWNYDAPTKPREVKQLEKWKSEPDYIRDCEAFEKFRASWEKTDKKEG